MQEVSSYVKELLNQSSDRYLIGITGAPGSGKSYLANWLRELINDELATDCAVVVGMDGYHYSDEILQTMNLSHLKGVPESFDAKGFLAKLQEIVCVQNANVYAPIFDRSQEKSVENGVIITPYHKFIIVEGNYLLYQAPIWEEVAFQLNEVWFLDVNLSELLPRLISRHSEKGLGLNFVNKKIDSTDIPNAKLVESTRHLANKVVRFDLGQAFLSIG